MIITDDMSDVSLTVDDVKYCQASHGDLKEVVSPGESRTNFYIASQVWQIYFADGQVTFLSASTKVLFSYTNPEGYKPPMDYREPEPETENAT